MQGIAGGNRSSETATTIVRDLQVFFQTMTPRGDQFKIKILLNQKNLEHYYHHLKTSKKYKPTTNAEKLRRLRLAIRFLLHNQEEDQDQGMSIYRSDQAMGALIVKINFTAKTKAQFKCDQKTSICK